jgi:hypothetical protein
LRHHLEVLSRLHALWGALGVLTGAALGILAVGTGGALVELGSFGRAGQAGVWIFAASAGLLVGGGVTAIAIGRALRRRSPAARLAALGLAVPTLIIVPFGTALGAYAFWVLLNDDARREFGRPERAAGPSFGKARP